MTMTLINTVTVGASGQAAMEFTNIPQTAKDLFILISDRNGNGNLQLSFNGVVTNRYAIKIYGNLATVTNDRSIGLLGTGIGTTANTFGNHSLYVCNYASTTLQKSISYDGATEENGSVGYNLIGFGAGLWDATTAITSLSLYNPNGTNFAQYSTASLYTISTTGATGATVA